MLGEEPVRDTDSLGEGRQPCISVSRSHIVRAEELIAPPPPWRLEMRSVWNGPRQAWGLAYEVSRPCARRFQYMVSCIRNALPYGRNALGTPKIRTSECAPTCGGSGAKHKVNRACMQPTFCSFRPTVTEQPTAYCSQGNTGGWVADEGTS
jgi:hypothetical protein